MRRELISRTSSRSRMPAEGDAHQAGVDATHANSAAATYRKAVVPNGAGRDNWRNSFIAEKRASCVVGEGVVPRRLPCAASEAAYSHSHAGGRADRRPRRRRGGRPGGMRTERRSLQSGPRKCSTFSTRRSRRVARKKLDVEKLQRAASEVEFRTPRRLALPTSQDTLPSPCALQLGRPQRRFGT